MATKSLRALLANVIDYAGLFPPASLPLDIAIRNYARYRTEPESWMLGRFICPAAQLAELSPYVDELFADGPPLSISALGGGPNDAQDIASFRARHEGRALVDVYETKIKLPRRSDSAWLKQLRDSLPTECAVYFEPAGTTGRHDVVTAAAVLRAGIKLRCGGVEAAAFPTPTQVALVLLLCQRDKVPLKFTAGLHHPLRHHDRGLGCDMHGFINVFAAGVFLSLGYGNDGLLEERNPANFTFSDDGMFWNDQSATVEQIDSARRQNVMSFGSCSFDEPRDDLRALGWL